MTTELIIKALNNAYEAQRPGDDLIFHSDLGSQYTSEAFGQVIQSYNITHFFSYKGIESFHAILKKEEVIFIQLNSQCFNILKAGIIANEFTAA